MVYRKTVLNGHVALIPCNFLNTGIHNNNNNNHRNSSSSSNNNNNNRNTNSSLVFCLSAQCLQ